MGIAVIGLWHQGIVGAACLADAGYDVVAADTDTGRVATLQDGKAPLYEPGLDELLQKGLQARKLSFTTDLAAAVRGCRDVLLMIDTPVNDRDESDLSTIFAAVRALAPVLADETVLYVTAQVPVGTCDELAAIIRALRPGLRFGIAYSPENLRLGQAIERFRKPPLPVVGADEDWILDRVEALMKPFEARWHRVNLRTAEMCKHALNSFLATSVTFANELGNLCDEVGADGHRLAEVLRLEPRVGPKAMLFPGLGFAGGTLARDVQTLRKIGDRQGLETPLLDGLWQSNQAQNGMVLHKLKQALGKELKGRRIAVLGLTYKADTSTLRRSAALEVIESLHREGAIVQATDPKADRGEVAACKSFTFMESPYEAAMGAEAIVLMTPWAQYKEIVFSELRKRVKGPVLIDTANLWPASACQQAGFTYMDIGRGRKAVAS